MPHKAMITWADEPGTEERHGRIMAMPAYVGSEFDIAGLKWIPSVPENPARHGLPRANALVVLTSRETGLPLAVMDGTVVSAMRTGAVTGSRSDIWPIPTPVSPACWGRECLHIRGSRRFGLHCPCCARCASTTRPPSAAAVSASARGRRAASTCARPQRRSRPCAAPPSSCPPRWLSSQASPPAGSIRARPSYSSRAWTARSTCRRSPMCWSSTTGSTRRPMPAGTRSASSRQAFWRRTAHRPSSSPTSSPGAIPAHRRGGAHRGLACRAGHGRCRGGVARAAGCAPPRTGDAAATAIGSAGLGVSRPRWVSIAPVPRLP
jgi:Ornithine cyclodeaminase/mu-crystallin family